MIRDESGNPRFFGLYRGIVFDNNDPLGKVRLRVQVPQILAETPTQWAWPVEVASTKTTPPEVGQGVWVMFEGGDPSFPIWTGVFGNKVTEDLELLLKPLASDYSRTDANTYLAFATTTAEGTPSLDISGSLLQLATSLGNVNRNPQLPTVINCGGA